MAEHRIIRSWSVLGKGLHCAVIGASDPAKIWESLKEELF